MLDGVYELTLSTKPERAEDAAAAAAIDSGKYGGGVMRGGTDVTAKASAGGTPLGR